jgi:hypothetical protein
VKYWEAIADNLKNWIGHDQVRHFKFDGRRLLLSTPPLMWDGHSFEYVLTWERIS